MKFAIVIPALDESRGLAATIGSVRTAAGSREIELVVVDGGSVDDTPRLAAASGALVYAARGGRGAQLAEGVRRTRGDVLVFLHADTWLPPDALAAIEGVLVDRAVTAGGFPKSFREGPAVVRRGGRWRSKWFFRLTGIVMGDQTLFVRRTALESVGGVPLQPLMEDVELSRRLGRDGRLVLVDAEVTTSGRRFERRGPLATWAVMGAMLAGYWLGVAPGILERWYRRTG